MLVLFRESSKNLEYMSEAYKIEKDCVAHPRLQKKKRKAKKAVYRNIGVVISL